MRVQSYPLLLQVDRDFPLGIDDRVRDRGQANQILRGNEKFKRYARPASSLKERANEISFGAVRRGEPGNATHLEVIQHHQGLQLCFIFFCRKGKLRKGEMAGEKEKGSESQGVEYPLDCISLAPLVFPLQESRPPSIAHTPTV
jgi:hypothetical protein